MNYRNTETLVLIVGGNASVDTNFITDQFICE